MKLLGLAIFIVMISSSSFADDFFNPPPLNPELPPWMQDSNQKQGDTQPGQTAPSTTTPDPGTATPPTTTETPSFEGSSDDEETPFDFEGGSSGGGGGASDQGKENFQLLKQGPQGKSSVDCIGWGNSFLGAKVFTSESVCRNELDQQLENSRDKITNYTDHAEKEVLRGVIKGKIPREKSKDFHLEFSALKDSLSLAGKTGCRCLE